MCDPTDGSAPAGVLRRNEKSEFSLSDRSTSHVSSVIDSGFGRSARRPPINGNIVVPAAHVFVTPIARWITRVVVLRLVTLTTSHDEKSSLAMIHAAP